MKSITLPRLDFVIFGATGFTGKHAVIEMARMAKTNPGITWGVAARCQEKLNTLMAEVAEKTGQDVSKVEIITADIKDAQSLMAMCERAKVLVNCCGPYRVLGEPVVAAAIQSKTHYVDVCGESEFMEHVQIKYDSLAHEMGVYVICSCGFDCIPIDMGVIFLQQNFEGNLDSVRAYVSGSLPPGGWKELWRHGIVNYGTWRSILYSTVFRRDLPALSRNHYPKKQNFSKSKLNSGIHWLEGGRVGLPWPSADAAVVRRTQRHLAARDGHEVHFRAFVALPFLIAVLAAFFVILNSLFAAFRVTRWLLLEHPRFFSCRMVSRSGPSEALTEGLRFRVELQGQGRPRGAPRDSPPQCRILARVSGTNPGYGATVVAVLLCARTILQEKELMPPNGGVMTTGVAFRKTSLIQNLNNHGITFEIVHNDQSCHL